MKQLEALRVLVVEDEALIGMLVEDMLLDMGCGTVDVVATVETALKFLGDANPDFAFLDLNLNGRQSYPIADVLRQRDIPFVFLSGQGGDALAGPYAACHTLQKPFQSDDLATALNKYAPDMIKAQN